MITLLELLWDCVRFGGDDILYRWLKLRKAIVTGVYFLFWEYFFYSAILILVMKFSSMVQWFWANHFAFCLTIARLSAIEKFCISDVVIHLSRALGVRVLKIKYTILAWLNQWLFKRRLKICKIWSTRAGQYFFWNSLLSDTQNSKKLYQGFTESVVPTWWI